MATALRIGSLPPLTGASAVLETIDAASTLTGPPLVCVLVRAIGPVLACGTDACSYGFSASTLARLPAGAFPAPPVDELGGREPGSRQCGRTLENAGITGSVLQHIPGYTDLGTTGRSLTWLPTKRVPDLDRVAELFGLEA
ncbi:MAG: hypothetical protein ACXVCO_17395 [Ktedonobacterales bacterium]